MSSRFMKMVEFYDDHLGSLRTVEVDGEVWCSIYDVLRIIGVRPEITTDLSEWNIEDNHLLPVFAVDDSGAVNFIIALSPKGLYRMSYQYSKSQANANSLRSWYNLTVRKVFPYSGQSDKPPFWEDEMMLSKKLASWYGADTKWLESKMCELGVCRPTSKQGLFRMTEDYKRCRYIKREPRYSHFGSLDGKPIGFDVYWTKRGQDFVYKLLRDNGILPGVMNAGRNK